MKYLICLALLATLALASRDAILPNQCQNCPTPMVSRGCRVRETLTDSFVPYPACCAHAYCNNGRLANDPACAHCGQPKMRRGCRLSRSTDWSKPFPRCCPQVECSSGIMHSWDWILLFVLEKGWINERRNTDKLRVQYTLTVQYVWLNYNLKASTCKK